MKNSLPLVSVVFPNWNGINDVKAYLKSLSQVSLPKEALEIIMVDNASTDGSISFVRNHFPGVKIISLSENFGPSYARNRGIDIAKGQYVFCSDNDTVTTPDAISHLLTVLQANPLAGIAGGKVLKKNQNHDIESAGGYLFNKWLGVLRDHPDKEHLHECDFLIGCAMIVKRNTVEHIGKFDELLRYFEDADLCLRAKKAGYKVLYEPKAIFYHGKARTTKRYSIQEKFTFWHNSHFRFLLKHASTMQIITSFTAHMTVMPVLRYWVMHKRQQMPSILMDYFLIFKALLWNVTHR